MGKNKLRRFAELTSLKRIYQPEVIFGMPDSELKGHWNKNVFQNNNPVVLEVGCGRGEYTVALAERYKDKNFIGIDIKGARLWRGVKTINEKNILNAAFLRIRIDFIEKFFTVNEVSEIWITFPDPQPKLSRENKRLTSALFLNRYKKFLKPGAIIYLKTDNYPLYEYSKEVAEKENANILFATHDLYHSQLPTIDLETKTHYENIYLAKGVKICFLKYQV